MRALEPQLLHVAAEPPRLSVVAPLLNEEETLGPLYGELRAALEPLGIEWEIVYDASQNVEVLRKPRNP